MGSLLNVFFDKIFGELDAAARTGLLLLVIGGGLVLHILWVFGALPFTSGFALASDVEEHSAQMESELKEQITQVEERLNEKLHVIDERQGDAEERLRQLQIAALEEQILKSRERQCKATSVEARNFNRGILQERLRKYEETTGRSFQLPTCEEI